MKSEYGNAKDIPIFDLDVDKWGVAYWPHTR
jgi:hypothetical protein